MSPGSALRSRAVKRCRICGSAELYRYLELGRTPLANAYRSREELGRAEFAEELCLQLCRKCGLSQLTQVVHPDRMFRNYHYVSSTTRTMRDHFGAFAEQLVKTAGAKRGELALDIASNDGLLLECFQRAGLAAVGVDPAANLAREARRKGLRTLNAYWSEAAARRIVKSCGRPKAITAANVFAHADDLGAFLRGVSLALAPGGVFAIECPWVVDFISKNEFDTAYHEHLSYLGATPLSRLLEAHGLELFDADYFPKIHGGTLRALACRRGERRGTARLARLLERERRFGILDAAAYDAFSARVSANKRALLRLLARVKSKGRRVWAYGASAKGNTLMNFYGLTAASVPKVVDDNPKKWGLFAPGSGMEIVGISALRGAQVDYLILLAWNFEAEIRRRCNAAGYRGGFIVPVPSPKIIGGKGT